MSNALHFSSRKTLQWLPELGIGWYPVDDQPYDAAYWERYRKMDQSSSGELLTQMRSDWVAQHASTSDLCDIGIGGGRFTEEVSQAGFDVNPSAIDWLKTNGFWRNPYVERFSSLTFWDSLEHIADPRPLLEQIRTWAFVSIPIFKDSEHILRSKHFRKDEHCWYFTRAGFQSFMKMHGFECRGVSIMEQNAGREDIETFAFRRCNHG